jgi:hypothetical protein
MYAFFGNFGKFVFRKCSFLWKFSRNGSFARKVFAFAKKSALFNTQIYFTFQKKFPLKSCFFFAKVFITFLQASCCEMFGANIISNIFLKHVLQCKDARSLVVPIILPCENQQLSLCLHYMCLCLQVHKSSNFTHFSLPYERIKVDNYSIYLESNKGSALIISRLLLNILSTTKIMKDHTHKFSYL